MIVLVDYNHVWETQYNQSFILDTEKLDAADPSYAIVMDTIKEALNAEDNDIQISEQAEEIFRDLIHFDKVDWKRKGKKIDEEITLWWE